MALLRQGGKFPSEPPGHLQWGLGFEPEPTKIIILLRAGIVRNRCIIDAVGQYGPVGGRQVMFMPESLTDIKAKDDFATMSKLAAIACGATMAVMALESWLKVAKPGEDFDPTELPSEAFDREEVIVLMGESMAEGNKQQILPIIRSGNRKFFGFGDSNVPKFDKMEGRFSQLLPAKAPDRNMRALALAMLQAKGVLHFGDHH